MQGNLRFFLVDLRFLLSAFGVMSSLCDHLNRIPNVVQKAPVLTPRRLTKTLTGFDLSPRMQTMETVKREDQGSRTKNYLNLFK